MAQIMLRHEKQSLAGKRCLISGSGKVALHTAEKLLDLGAVPIGFSDNFGFVIEPEGFSREQLQALRTIKSERTARIGSYIMSSTSAKYVRMSMMVLYRFVGTIYSYPYRKIYR